MNPMSPFYMRVVPLAFAVLLAAGTGVSLAMWFNKGARLYQTLAETGLAWCL